MPLTLTDVQSDADLLSVLGEIDIGVPARTDGRKTYHTETYIACRLLSTLTASNRLTFPLSVSQRDPPNDRPDVLMHTGNARLGIEITEAIPNRFAALCAFAEKEFPGHWLPIDLFRRDSEVLSKDEMRALLRADARTVGGWVGDAPEREWALFMKGVVESKLTKLAQDGFEKADQNWLSIYDNLPLPNVHLVRAIEMLTPLLKEVWAAVPKFDALFIEHGPVIARIAAEDTEYLDIKNLWQS
jgi:hypothetical protein